jgi:hypothetical protein
VQIIGASSRSDDTKRIALTTTFLDALMEIRECPSQPRSIEQARGLDRSGTSVLVGSAIDPSSGFRYFSGPIHHAEEIILGAVKISWVATLLFRPPVCLDERCNSRLSQFSDNRKHTIFSFPCSRHDPHGPKAAFPWLSGQRSFYFKTAWIAILSNIAVARSASPDGPPRRVFLGVLWRARCRRSSSPVMTRARSRPKSPRCSGSLFIAGKLGDQYHQVTVADAL